jgi:hypothetical protein
MAKLFNGGQLTILTPLHRYISAFFLTPPSKLAPRGGTYILKIRMQKQYNNLLPGTKNILFPVWKSGIKFDIFKYNLRP